MTQCMNFVILGDKFQKRMKSRGCVGLIKINNKTIIQHQYKNIKSVFPEANIIYVYGFESKKFINFINKNPSLQTDIITINNPNYETTNSTLSLYLASQYLNDDCFITFGDNLLNSSVFHKFDQNNGSQVFINKKHKNKIGCIINNDTVENIAYDLDNYLSEIYYLSKEDCHILQNLIDNAKYHNYFIFEILNKLIDQNRLIKPFFINSKTSTSLASY